MSEDQLIGIIYSQLIEEFGFGYSDKDLWMIAENIAEKIVNQIPQLNDNQKIVFEWLEEYYAKSQWPFPFYVLKHAANDMSANIFGFYDDFTMKEEFEVLAAFAQWGLEREEEE
ncbi:hypothetical protein [Enterococcus lactis]|uniref:hypothetical protein n=1 Tax=Enterococcus lactis TaxID=357441 RepID=UPI0028F41452|nr:hypothetical protein [Enterococcus lactis]